MGNLALMLCSEDPLAKLMPEFLPEAERIEAFLWANLCCLAEKVDSPAEKEQILNSSNGALQSLRYFTAGRAYALTGLVMDSEGVNTPFIVFRERCEDAPENATKLLLTNFERRDFFTTKGTLVGQAVDDYVDQMIALRESGLIRWAVQSARLSTKGLTIAGHGVGAAIANLLAVELLMDYGAEFPIRLRTFGAPRVFTMPTAESIKHLPVYNKMSFTRYINDGDCFPSLPVRFQGLGHIGTASKYDPEINKWKVGKFSDIAVEANHILAPHFFQGPSGYIQNLRRTLTEDGSKSASIDFSNRGIEELDKTAMDLRLDAVIAGKVTVYDYSQKRDGTFVDQQNTEIIEE